MKLTKEKNPVTGKITLIFEVEEIEIVKAMPTKMEYELLKIAIQTEKISDWLLYWSEVAENIEASMPQNSDSKEEESI